MDDDDIHADALVPNDDLPPQGPDDAEYVDGAQDEPEHGQSFIEPPQVEPVDVPPNPHVPGLVDQS